MELSSSRPVNLNFRTDAELVGMLSSSHWEQNLGATLHVREQKTILAVDTAPRVQKKTKSRKLRFFLGETLCREKLGGIAEAGRQRLVSLLDVHFEHQRQLLTKNQTQPRAKSPSTPAYLDMTRSSPRK
ncbi:hypothetical protein AAG570_009983 [Ranatra chinensis]|uniref:Uncharacterized protein n=1 Tax=Ranatra chinensis TaxID=642074 RepID=A0ABD0YR05_9HEMI